MKKVFAAVLCTLLMATGAYAKSFYGQYYLSGDAYSNPGLAINTHPSYGSGSFHLDAGETKHIDLFRIWTNESHVNVGEDTVPQSLNVHFNFDSIGSGTLSGNSTGVSIYHGVLQGGHASWNNPLVLTFGKNNNKTLTLSLSGAYFNWGLFGTFAGYEHGADVKLTATYDVAPVPLPASALLLLGGVASLGLMRRRRKAA